MSANICDVCREPFDRAHHLQKRHLGSCTQEYDRRTARERYQRKVAKVRTWNPDPQKCEYCTAVFKPWVKGQVTCGSLDCKKKHKVLRNKMLTKAWRDAEKARKYSVLLEKPMKCPFEDMDFLPPGCRSFLEAQMTPLL
jgi:hypothetical protein